MEYIALLSVLLINIVLFGTVLYSGPRLRANQLFSTFLIFITIWMVSSFSLDNLILSYASQEILAHIAYITPIWAVVTISLFIKTFPRRTSIKGKLPILIYGLAILGTLLALDPQFILEIKKEAEIAQIEVGATYPIYMAILLSLFTFGVYWFFRNKKYYNASEKKEARYIMTGIVTSFVLIILSNGILPVTNPELETTKFGAVGTLPFIVMSSYAIIRQRSFSISLAIWRTIMYITSLLILVGALSLFVITISSTVIKLGIPGINSSTIYVISMILAALLFQPLKNKVDVITNRFFFHQSYSVNTSFNEISKFITHNVKLDDIQKYVIEVFKKTIQPTHTTFLLKIGDTYRIIGQGLVSESAQELYSLLSGRPDFIFTDVLENKKDHFKNHLQANDISISIKLISNRKVLGYMLMGGKKNGRKFSNKDIQLVTLTANDLALALENAQRYQEIQQFNRTLKQKVSEATAALKRTNSKLMALDDAKDEFISMASHQMRTPLTSVKGYISMLLEEDLGKLNKAQKQALKEAFDSSQRMVFLISDFLNVSRIRTGRFMIEPSVMSMPEVVKQEISQLRDMAAYKEQKIQYVDPQDFPLVSLDENKVRQVMMNMIDNAMYYTPKGGVIDIILEKTDKEIVFKVVDSGIGVPAKEQHRLFTKFFRAANARRARPDGTGLGLFMAQKIITAQKGRIIFNSEENKGSTFGFRFPLKDIVIDNKS